MKHFFGVWLPIALCLAGLVLIVIGIVMLNLVHFEWLPRDATFIAARTMGFGASLILSGATTAAVHAGWTVVTSRRKVE